MGRLFGTDGVRGVWGRGLTLELALRLARAIGSYFGRGSRILVGRDTRYGGEYLAHVIMAGLAYEGVKVYYAGVTPTPSLQLYVKNHGFDGGVMVTASHNPPEYNGVKVLGPEGVEISREDERVIEEIYFEGRFGGPDIASLSKEPATLRGVNDFYISTIISAVDRDKVASRGFKVVVDCGNGATSLTSPYIVRGLGAKPIALNCSPDPGFPGREPEPRPETLKDASRLVATLGADLGVGHDADGDRAIFIDSRGEAHWGDRSGALLARYAKESGLVDAPSRVYTGVSSSILVEEYLRPAGIEVVWTPVGAVVISHTMKRNPGIAGFEENGGYIHPPHQLVRDGGMTIALMLQLMADEKVGSSDLFRRLPRYYPVKTKIPVASRDEASCYVEEAKKMFKGARLVTIDGVKAIGDGYWVLVRPSGTEPVVRVMVEARSREEAEGLAKKIIEALREACRG